MGPGAVAHRAGELATVLQWGPALSAGKGVRVSEVHLSKRLASMGPGVVRGERPEAAFLQPFAASGFNGARRCPPGKASPNGRHPPLPCASMGPGVVRRERPNSA